MSGMLDISIPNADKVLTTSSKILDFLNDEIEIQEKVDGIKLTIVKVKHQTPKGKKIYYGDISKDFIVAYKRSVLYKEDNAGVDRTETAKHSIGDAQFAFVFDHLSKNIEAMKKLPDDTEFFIEYTMNKPTITRDYDDKHRMILIGYSKTKWVETQGLLTTYPDNFEVDNVKEYAKLMGIDSPRTILSGKIKPFDVLLSSSVDESLIAILKDRKSQFTSDPEEYLSALKKALLDVPSMYGGKMEGVVIVKNDGMLKFLQDDQHDKKTRADKKLRYQMESDDENAYFLKLKSLAQREIIPALNLHEKLSGLIEKISRTAYSYKKFPEHAKKNLLQKQEDFFHVCKYLVLKKLPGNNSALFIGRLQPPTKTHIKIIRDALNDFDSVTVALVRGKNATEHDNPFSLDVQTKILKSAFPKGIDVIQVSTGNVLSAMNQCRTNINAVLCGSDRVESYRNQLKNNPEIAVVETMRNDGVSGTIVRDSLRRNDRNKFETLMDPSSFSFFELLKGDLNEDRFHTFESFSKTILQ